MNFQCSKILFAGLCLSLIFLSGCMGLARDLVVGNLNGFIYTKIKVPYTVNLDNTPVVLNEGKGKIVQINEPLTGYDIHTRFNSNAIADIAEKYGFKKVYFADVEYFSILGIWEYEKLFLYGE